VTSLLLPFLLAAHSFAPAGLADSLFSAGDYYAAATEYRRDLFFGSASDPALERLKLGLSYGASGETGRAARALRDAGEAGPGNRFVSGLALAGLRAGTDNLDGARLELLDLLAFESVPERRSRLDASLGWLEARDGNLVEASASYDRTGKDDVARELERIAGLRPKNPTVALVLSSFLPGTGEFYAGRPLNGLLSLVVNGASAAGVYLLARDDDWVSAVVVFAAFFLRFYSGSRSNAVDFSEDFNLALREKELDRLIAEMRLRPDWFGPAESLTGLPVRTALASPAPGKGPGSAPAPVRSE